MTYGKNNNHRMNTIHVCILIAAQNNSFLCLLITTSADEREVANERYFLTSRCRYHAYSSNTSHPTSVYYVHTMYTLHEPATSSTAGKIKPVMRDDNLKFLIDMFQQTNYRMLLIFMSTLRISMRTIQMTYVNG